MIRKTILGLAAVAALTAAASSADAGVKVYFGGPGYGWGYHAPYYGAYYGGYFGGYYGGYNCHKVIVGWKKYWNGHHWKKKPVFKKICNYGY